MYFKKQVPSWHFYDNDPRWEDLKSEQNFTVKRSAEELSGKSNSTRKVLTCDHLRVSKERQERWRGTEDKDAEKSWQSRGW